jgi:hypothetical protein
MKRNFFALMLICLIMWSCKKESSKDTTDTGGKSSHKITFMVGFSKQTTDFKTNGLTVNSTNRPLNTQALANQVDVIYFAIYNNKGNKVKVTKQVSTDAGFGTFTEGLTIGNYTIVVAAGKTGLALSNDIAVDSSSLNTDILTYNPSNQGIPFNKDAFYKKVPLTIPGDASQTINLDRITSGMQVVIKDAIPSNAKTLSITVTKIANKFYIGSGTAARTIGGLELRSTFTPTDIGALNYTVSSQPFLALPKSDVTLYCSSGQAYSGISRAVVADVMYMPNKRTVLTGNLFGGAGNPVGNGFQLVADTSWNGTHSNNPF